MRPELVVEIALDGVQVSTRYPGGVALRFARVRRYRPDKAPADADTIDAVRALLPPDAPTPQPRPGWGDADRAGAGTDAGAPDACPDITSSNGLRVGLECSPVA